MGTQLPSIPAKRYFTIGEVADLCGVKPHVLRYWEQEFTQLRPMKRRGNRRYYQHHEVLMIRRIRDLLYDQGFTISGARNRLQDSVPAAHDEALEEMLMPESVSVLEGGASTQGASIHGAGDLLDSNAVRQELFEIRALLSLN
ncbi:MerR family transcriptional regulator [Acidovorax sp. JG5]|uniref:MerR family transcriptional regulator n=1 Tax=Acidovorax sp. JG5 TaxID=2822718 RepID=UPI001B344247|nr:MerR family transcriptional regulator [Acidovorax sp. JG5]MBP3982677.1 MerR family transcriptional regulator [Acidovorax sp. JG5]